MPRVLDLDGFRFFFYSNEGDPREPLHIHVRKERNLAKFWIFPEVALADSYGFSSKELNKIRRIIDNNKSRIEEAWNEHFNS
jgi:Paraquat-inducible protein B